MQKTETGKLPTDVLLTCLIYLIFPKPSEPWFNKPLFYIVKELARPPKGSTDVQAGLLVASLP